jgi:hypothetical protein
MPVRVDLAVDMGKGLDPNPSRCCHDISLLNLLLRRFTSSIMAAYGTTSNTILAAKIMQSVDHESSTTSLLTPR